MTNKVPDWIIVSQQFLIGMPQLSLGGLSENWLLKECGHQHWLALAKHLGLDKPHFIDQKGRQMYAAFLVVKLSDANLDFVEENQTLSIVTQLVRISASRSYSRHEVQVNNVKVASLELLSSFVSRQEQGNNQTVARAEFGRGSWASCDAASALIEAHKAGRIYSTLAHLSFPAFVYHPCPYADFNGADFLYFAQFQAIMDRAERGSQKDAQLWSTQQRTICYYGNINLDDGLSCHLIDEDDSGDSHNQKGQIYRLSDKVLIASIHTKKKRISHPNQQWSEKRNQE